MLPVRLRLTHGTLQSSHISPLRTQTHRPQHLLRRQIYPQCQHQNRMSRTRPLSTSPEGNKRRKLSTTARPSRLLSPPKMAPILVQDVSDDTSIPTTLELTPVEDTLRRLLLDVAAYIDNNPVASGQSQVPLPPHLAEQKVTLRFTGGWVRDKLLGVPSHDIDVAINKMTGEQFGYRMKEYLDIPGNPEKYGLEGVATNDKQSQKAGATAKSKVVGGLHKIEANPEKSKHLETVTTRILGLDIDLVNLRKETYTDDSRNPQMEFGTPEEDAMRRDATVNALFYNINTSKIEDFTGRGHEDMRNKIIRTPLEPYQTFKDDPLRVMRLIRFSSRLNYSIEQSALDAMRDESIKDALRRKISRERVGTELEKALYGPDPHEALRLIYDLDLYFTIFSDPTNLETHYQPDIANWEVVIDCLEDAVNNDSPIGEILMSEGDERFMAWQLSAFLPYRDAPQPPPLAPGRKPPPPIAASVAREGIKATNKVCDVVVFAIRHQQEISNLVEKSDEQKRRPDKIIQGEDATARDVLGMAIRRWGPTWRSQVVWAFLADILDSLPSNNNAVAASERKYTAFIGHLRDLDLLHADTFKPVIDGKGLASALGIKPGPWMKDALDTVMAWQLRNPNVTDPTEAIEVVRQGRGELSRALARHFLSLTIRPLFQKTKPSAVTNQGRKVTTTVLPKRLGIDNEDENIVKPWKTEKDGTGLAILRWVVNTLDEKQVEEVWPLIIPPVLTLLDDWEAQYKLLGASLLHRILTVTPPALLKRTGLGEVFEQALIPCLSHLPTLTPEPEAIDLLNATYPALLKLIELRFPGSTRTETKAAPPTTTIELLSPRTKNLDSLLRSGPLHAHAHASQYPRILAVSYTHLTSILDALGLETVKHLQILVPMLNETLTNRILAGSTHGHATLSAAAQAMQSVLRNAWPRIEGRRLEVLKGVTACWINSKGQEANGLRGELRGVVHVLDAILASTGADVQEEWKDEKRQIVQAEKGLKGLFE